MEEDAQEQRRRKLEAGRAKLAHFRQRKAEGDCAYSKKKTAKRKGPAVDAPVQEERPVAAKDSGRLGGRDDCRPCGDLPVGATGPSQAQDLSMDQNQLEIKKAQARITELEVKLLNRQETINRLELEVKELQGQLAQCPGSVPCHQECEHEQQHKLEVAESISRQRDEGGWQQQTQELHLGATELMRGEG
ncbi:pericentrin-like [Ochotona princeps]|uniref:pericentrin-like n=1 Tax=Ochotona princeps TaxID=9978 RepID=UPI002715133E|nr:pericentrin-like [Ochotona princeps]